MIKLIIKLLLKIPAFRRLLVFEAFKISYSDTEEMAKLEYKFSDSAGHKYFGYIRPEWMPIQRYEQMQLRLLEIESRISRESLLNYSKAQRLAAEKKDFVAVAQLVGELERRLDVLYDPELLMRLISGLYIREDQIKTAHIWNDSIEDEKFKQLVKDNEGGSLSFFFQKSGLMNHVRLLDGSNGNSANILTEPVIQNQLKEVRLFDQMILEASNFLSKQR